MESQPMCRVRERESSSPLTNRDKLHSQIGQDVFEQIVFLGRKIATRFCLEHAEHIDQMSCSFEIERRRLFALTLNQAEMHRGFDCKHLREAQEGSFG